MRSVGFFVICPLIDCKTPFDWIDNDFDARFNTDMFFKSKSTLA